MTGSLILASASPTRRMLMEAAGLACRFERPDVDEAALKSRAPGLSGPALAMMLARAKALEVSARNPDALVIGADQVLAGPKRLHDKPNSIDDAKSQLKELRGETHALETAVCCARGPEIVWSCGTSAKLRMRAFSDGFLDAYCARMGERLLSSVGGYQIEGLGLQLFDSVEGDHFTILGLPMLELLGFLRGEGIIGT